jgi:hypothetical protein
MLTIPTRKNTDISCRFWIAFHGYIVERFCPHVLQETTFMMSISKLAPTHEVAFIEFASSTQQRILHGFAEHACTTRQDTDIGVIGGWVTRLDILFVHSSLLVSQ